MLEKRLAKRRHFFYTLEVYEQGKEDKLGFIGDISSDGLMFVSETKWYPLEKTYQIRIKLPGQLKTNNNEEEQYLPLSVIIKWIKVDTNPQLFRIGCQINHIAEEYKPILKSLVELVEDSD